MLSSAKLDREVLLILLRSALTVSDSSEESSSEEAEPERESSKPAVSVAQSQSFGLEG